MSLFILIKLEGFIKVQRYDLLLHIIQGKKGHVTKNMDRVRSLIVFGHTHLIKKTERKISIQQKRPHLWSLFWFYQFVVNALNSRQLALFASMVSSRQDKGTRTQLELIVFHRLK